MTKLWCVGIIVCALGCSKKQESPPPAANPPPGAAKPAGEPAGSAAPATPSAAAPATPPAPAKKNACSYLTVEEASAIFGTPMKYRSNDGTSSNCILDSVDETKAMSVDFEVTVDTSDYDYAAKDGTKVDGVGEKATYSEPQLYAVKGGRTAKATVLKNGKMQGVLPEAKALVGKIVEKM